MNSYLNVTFWYVLFHLQKKTEDLIGEEQLNCMKKTAYIINIARAAIFDEKALYDYLKNGKIAGAALDVFVR